VKSDERGGTEGLGKGCDASATHGAQGEFVGPRGPLLVHVAHAARLGLYCGLDHLGQELWVALLSATLTNY
jgi:hypothetical protein